MISWINFLADIFSFTERVWVISQWVAVALSRKTFAHDAPGWKYLFSSQNTIYSLIANL